MKKNYKRSANIFIREYMGRSRYKHYASMSTTLTPQTITQLIKELIKRKEYEQVIKEGED